MTRAELKLAAKSQIKGKLGTFFLSYLMIYAFCLVVGFIPIPVVKAIISFVVTPSLSIGIILISLMCVHNQNISLTDFFNGFNYFVKAFVLFLLIGIFTLLWSLLLIVPGIIKSYAYKMAPYILAENPEMSPLDCITASKNMMEGYKADLFVLDLSFIGWILLTGVTLGIAGIYVYPYTCVTYGNFYTDLKSTIVASSANADYSAPAQPEQPVDEQQNGPEL